MENKSISSNYTDFLFAVYKKDLPKAEKISSFFESGCHIDDDKKMCAFHTITNNNRYYKVLRARDFIYNKFNKKINLNEK
jgi:hypothetical protein